MSGESAVPQRVLYRYRFGTAEFDESSFELRVEGRPVSAEHRVLQVLAYLLRHAGEVVSKEELLREIWCGRATVEKVLPNAVGKLRLALGEANARLVHSLPAVGYRLSLVEERTAAGQSFRSRLDLRAGAPVPGRPHFQLVRALAGTRANELWLATHRKTAERRVFKFAVADQELAALRREAVLARVLQDSLGERDDMVRLFDWNFQHAPYFLEYAYGGCNLLEWAADGGLERLSRPQRLELFLDLVEAVVAAHSVGVLHKDLKPANVLVSVGADGAPRLRLTDFGSGRLLEPDRLAALGITQLESAAQQDGSAESTMGTPMYLAPELLLGGVPTVQSDVYALGVMLYQLLVGDLAKPLTAGWEQELGDPLLAGDIAAAAQGKPALRLASVSELGQRLRALETRRARARALADAEARRVLAEEQLRQARARRPWIAAVIAVLALGLGASLWFFQAERATRLEVARHAETAEVINVFLAQHVLNAVDPAQRPGTAVTLDYALDQAAERVDARFSGPSAAAVHLSLSRIYREQGRFSQALQHGQQAVDQLDAAYGPAHEDTRRARYELAGTLAGSGDQTAASALLAEADRYALRGASALLRRSAHMSRAAILLQRARFEEAVPEFEQAIKASQAVAPEQLGVLALDPWIGLGQAYSFLHRYDEARALFEQVMAMADASDPAALSRTAATRAALGNVLVYQGRYTEAEPLLNAAYAETSGRYGRAHFRSLALLHSLAGLYAATGRWSEARKALREAAAGLARLLGEAHPVAAGAAGSLGQVEVLMGDYASAEVHLGLAYERLSASAGPQDPTVQCFAFYRAVGALAEGRADEAAQRAEDLDPSLLGAGCPGEFIELRLQALRGMLALEQGDRDRGRAMLEGALNRLHEQGAAPWLQAPLREALGERIPTNAE